MRAFHVDDVRGVGRCQSHAFRGARHDVADRARVHADRGREQRVEFGDELAVECIRSAFIHGIFVDHARTRTHVA